MIFPELIDSIDDMCRQGFANLAQANFGFGDSTMQLA